MLAGLPKAPSNYSPYLHPDRAYQRQAYVLNRMLEDGYITQAEKDRALSTAAPAPLDQAEGQDRPLLHREHPPLHPGEIRQRRPLQGGARGLHDARTSRCRRRRATRWSRASRRWRSARTMRRGWSRGPSSRWIRRPAPSGRWSGGAISSGANSTARPSPGASPDRPSSRSSTRRPSTRG